MRSNFGLLHGSLTLLLLLTACSSPMRHYAGDDPAMVYSPIKNAYIVDARAEYRMVFCKVMAAVPMSSTGPDCNAWLRRFDDEPVAAGAENPLAPLTPSVDIVIVTGIFGQCLPAVPAFGDAVARLRDLGYGVSYAPVRGRASSTVNAAIIRDHIARQITLSPARRVAIVSYSKGTADTMTALASYPELASQVAAVVSVAGAVNGSPLADELGTVYQGTLAGFPYRHCETGDGAEMHSISRQYRLHWLSTHELPLQPRYFSIVAVPDAAHVSPIFNVMHAQLAQIDPRNDGQVLHADAILPHSTLLGYVNTDHFGAALPFSSNSPLLSHTIINRNHYPRAVMLEASMYFVERALAAKP